MEGWDGSELRTEFRLCESEEQGIQMARAREETRKDLELRRNGSETGTFKRPAGECEYHATIRIAWIPANMSGNAAQRLRRVLLSTGFRADGGLTGSYRARYEIESRTKPRMLAMLRWGQVNNLLIFTGRGGGIRTPDPLLPKQMRYQTALRPDVVLDCIVERIKAKRWGGSNG